MKYQVNECCDCATDTYSCIDDEYSQLHKTCYRCDECGADGVISECEQIGIPTRLQNLNS